MAVGRKERLRMIHAQLMAHQRRAVEPIEMANRMARARIETLRLQIEERKLKIELKQLGVDDDRT